MRTLPWLLVVFLASGASAQTAGSDIRVTGVHAVSATEPADVAKQLALMDGERKLLQEVVTRLQDRAEVKALQLRSNQLPAFTAALVDIPEPLARNASTAKPTVSEVDLVLRFDAGEMLGRLRQLRRDQDACIALVEAWASTEELHRQLSSGSAQERQRLLIALRAKRLTAQVTVALAKTEERPVGGRGAAAEGRQRAKRLAEAALAMAPDSVDAHYAMGAVLMDGSEIEAAEAQYRKAILGNPTISSGHTRLANALLREQKVPEAGAELREALRIDPNSVPAHTDMGWVLKAQQNIPEAIAEYQAALRLDPDFIDAHNGLAVTLARQGRLPEAVEQFREIVRVDPDSAVGYYNLWYALADMDKDDESAAALREVVRINPNHYNARYNLGELFRLEGKFDESAKQFREFLRLAPAEPQNRRNIERAEQFVAKFENQ